MSTPDSSWTSQGVNRHGQPVNRKRLLDSQSTSCRGLVRGLSTLCPLNESKTVSTMSGQEQSSLTNEETGNNLPRKGPSVTPPSNRHRRHLPILGYGSMVPPPLVSLTLHFWVGSTNFKPLLFLWDTNWLTVLLKFYVWLQLVLFTKCEKGERKNKT